MMRMQILKKFQKWLADNNPKVLPQSALGKALTYAINQWPKLMVYLEDGRLEFSNNHMERAVKPFVIGRKNWLFANSVPGAEAAAIIYSLIETCKANKIATYDYLVYAFANLPLCKTLADYEAILPFNIEKKLLA